METYFYGALNGTSNFHGHQSKLDATIGKEIKRKQNRATWGVGVVRATMAIIRKSKSNIKAHN